MPLERRGRVSASDERTVIEAARGAPEDFVIALDVANGLVRVVRTEDATAVARAVDRAAAAESPYAVALVAAELLEVAREAPPAAALPPPEVPGRRRVDPARLRWSVALRAGAAFTIGLGGTVALLTP